MLIGVSFNQPSEGLLKYARSTTPEAYGGMTAWQIHLRRGCTKFMRRSRTQESKAHMCPGGHSRGALVVRFYAGQCPKDVVGMVFVDHAIAMIHGRPPPGGGAAARPMPPPQASPPGGGKIVVKVEDDPTFSTLPAQDRELLLWATTEARDKAAYNSVDMLSDRVTQANATIKDQIHPLGNHSLTLAQVPLHHCFSSSSAGPAWSSMRSVKSCSQSAKALSSSRHAPSFFGWREIRVN